MVGRRLRPTVTEYRAGTYAFHDRATVDAGAATLDDVALTVCATVVSRPARNRAILDAGSKALSSDRSAADGFGLVLEAPHSTLVKLDEEHGYSSSRTATTLEFGHRSDRPEPRLCGLQPLRRVRARARRGARRALARRREVR